jgi:3-phenylpropionate/trans-cinnamate dioxygenase ferredoxin reductase component
VSPSRQVEFLLIGGGMASAHCASELRKQGAEGEVMLVGREPHPPYERPPLSKEYMRGESSEEEAFVHAPEWYEENSVELLTGTNVMSLDGEGRVARLQTKEEIGFEKALVATGADVRILRVDGVELEGIHYLRTFKTSDEIQEDAESADHVVLIGGSYIACEVAASLTARGKKCTCVMLEEVALSRTFGEEAGRYFHDVLTSHGIDLVGGEELEAFLGEGRVSAVRTKSGREIEGDAVVVGAGVHPDVRLAGKAGLDVDNGVVCDERLQTSVEGIYAAGDLCSYQSAVHGRRLRVEHWDVALQQGQYAGRAMLGESEPYREVPYFFSDLADWASLEYVGPAEKWDEVIFRGDRAAGEFSAWYIDGGKVAGALSVERSEDLMVARRLIESGADVSGQLGELADVDSDLEAMGS